MSRIWDYPEFELSSDEDKSWAMSKGYPRYDLMDVVKHAKLPTQKSVTVKTNLGTAEITVVPVLWSLEPQGLTKTRLKDGYHYKTVWMIKGKSPTGKTSEYVTEKDLSDSDEVKTYAKEIKEAQTKFLDEYFNKLAIELHGRLSPAAKKAVKDGLAGLVLDKKTKALRQWFIDNKFDDVPEENDFKKMINLGGFIKKSGVDNWGHSTGSAIGIDWKDKKFYTYGWSSDD